MMIQLKPTFAAAGGVIAVQRKMPTTLHISPFGLVEYTPLRQKGIIGTMSDCWPGVRLFKRTTIINAEQSKHSISI
ncbi:hypothetical protein Y032_0002g1100 [Ancylostoma ceylanicum]|uniref:Uncharacterized protein n=1 Tax=Ancylostoma ceylanicum TaxID=53326 RepID=A0A016VZF3_9BILA|nr:hypothetical protein Y032_0002g1100 [Ancylostoma ceylanicum]